MENMYNLNNTNDIKIVTVATESQYYYPYLMDTLKKNGGTLTTLGFGEKWQGFSWRYQMMIDYLKGLNPNEIVCFVDGYDVICTRKLTELKSKFLELKNRHNCKIIVSNHKFKKDFPTKYVNIIYFGICKNDLINAGTYIGNAKDLLTLITNIYNLSINNSSDDQILMTKYCKKTSTDFYIDTKNEIFLVLESPYKEINENISIENGSVVYNTEKPFFIHGPGSTYLDNILIQLGYQNVNIKEELYRDYYKKICMYIHPKLYNFYSQNERNKILIALLLIIILIIIVIILLISIYYFLKNYKNYKKYKNFNNYKTYNNTKK